MGITVTVNGVKEVLSDRLAEMARARDIRQPNQRFGLRLRDRAIERLDQRQIKDRLTTNTLGRSIQTVNDPVAGSTFTNLKYARVQQDGHPNIKPTGGRKALAIPNAKNTALRRSGKWPSQFPKDTFRFVQLRRGKVVGFLFWNTPVDRRGNAVDKKRGAFGSQVGKIAFTLVNSVKIPARPYLFAEQVDIDFYAEQIRRHILGG